jgi:hypothetical protein
MVNIDCGAFIDEYSPLVRAGLDVSEHVSLKQSMYLREDLGNIVKLTSRLVKDYMPMVSTDILKMMKDEASDLIGLMDIEQKRGKPVPYDILEKQGTHFEMLALEAMILDTARCVCSERKEEDEHA